jgi:hypothetical protein
MDYFEIAPKVANEAVESISPLDEQAFIDSCKNKLNDKIKIDFRNDDWCSELPKSNGIYLFWADFSKWTQGLTDFSDKWGNAKKAISFYPNFNKRRASKHIVSEQKILPFYLGKAEKSIQSRVRQHVFIEGKKTTYALKLNAICEYQKSFKKIPFFISQLPLPFSDKSYFLLNIIEAKLRDELSPIVGRQ